MEGMFRGDQKARRTLLASGMRPMKGTLSFEQELRATRLASGQKKGAKPNPVSEPKENERPWQNDIEQVQQTLREVLRAVASLSGVEIPGLPANVQDDSAPAPKLNINTLKDRLRNDLEGFSLKTTEELAKRAREQTRAALEAVVDELGGRVEQAAAELREELQLPAQLDKLLQPCIVESAAGLEKSLTQKLEQLVAEQQRLIQDTLQSALSSVQAQVSALEQSAQQDHRLNTDSAAQTSAELNSTVDRLLSEQDRLIQERLQSALSSVKAETSAQLAAEFRELLQSPAQIEKLLEPCSAQAASRLESSFVPKVELLLNEQEQSLQNALTSIRAQVTALEKSVQQVRELKDESVSQASFVQQNVALEASMSEKVARLLSEQDRLIQERLQSALSSVKAETSAQLAAEFRELLQSPAQIEKLLEPCSAQAVSRLESSFVPKVELLLNEQEQSLQSALSSVQAQMAALEQSVQQTRELNAEPVSQTSVAQQNAALEASVSEKVARLIAEQERSMQARLQGALSSVQTQMTALEQSVQRVCELNAGPVSETSVAQQNAALEASVSQKVARLIAEQERSMQARLQSALSSIQVQITALERKFQQIHELEMNSVVPTSAEPSAAAAASALKKAEASLNSGIKDFLDRSFSRIEGSLNNLMESPRFKPVQSTHAKLESLRKSIPEASTDMLIRVQQALDNLDRLGSKDPIPAS